MNVLLIVDPQNDFIEGGKLPVYGAKKAMNNLVTWYKNNISNIEETFVTMDTHPEDHCSFDTNGGLWAPHCVDNTTGWLIYKPLAEVLINDSYYFKGCDPSYDEYSIFTQTNKDGVDLENYLNLIKDNNLNIYVAGIAGDICVLNTLKDLIRMGFKKNIKVLLNCIASIDGGKALEYLINDELLTFKIV